MDKIHFPYRSESHLPFLHVVAESGSWEKHGLQVEYDYFISADDAHKSVADGSVEFVSGNHLSTYAKRAQGDKWVYVGQTVNMLNHRLVTTAGSGISKVSDLKGKVVGTKGQHPGLNSWLFLKQNGLESDRGDVTIQRFKGEKGELWEVVRDGKADAAFIMPPQDIFALRAGLKVIDIDPLPMVWFTTVSTSMRLVDQHSEIVERCLKGIIEGIAFFKTHKQQAMKIIQNKYKDEGALDEETTLHLYNETAKILEAKPYPSMTALSNVYEIAIRQDKTAEKTPPLALWNFHFLRRIDDSGFIDGLYQT